MSRAVFEDFEDILKCVHCGLCLDACPTYRALGSEQDSPRGRLYIMRGLWEGELPPDDEVTAPLSRCLDCRACESACPSGVPYGALLEKARYGLRDKPMFRGAAVTRGLVFKLLLSRGSGPLWLSRIARPLRPFRKWFRHMPGSLGRAASLMPGFSGRSFKKEHPRVLPAQGEPRRRLLFFSGCVMDVSDAAVHEGTARLLRYLGYELEVPADQGCCGALSAHNGAWETAVEQARHNLQAFAGEHGIVVNAAGCGAHLKHLSRIPGNTETDHGTMKKFSARVRDWSEWAADAGESFAQLPWLDLPPEAVLYDAPCHLIHAQGGDQALRSVLNAVPGTDLIVPPETAYCCGAGGTYNLQHQNISDQVLAAKIADIHRVLEQKPEIRILVTANPGCAYQLQRGLGDRLQVRHAAEWIASRLPPL